MATYKTVNPFNGIDAAYIAGLIDGEGTITLTRKHRNGNRQLAITISNTWPASGLKPPCFKSSLYYQRRSRTAHGIADVISCRAVSNPINGDTIGFFLSMVSDPIGYRLNVRKLCRPSQRRVT